MSILNESALSIAIGFDDTVYLSPSRTTAGWWIHLMIGEWDTYREDLYFSRTKPTARQLRQISKKFKQSK